MRAKHYLAALAVGISLLPACTKQSKFEMPAAVAAVVKAEVPGAEIATMEVEEQGGIKLYDIEFEADRGEIEVAEDGTVMDISTIVQMKDVPGPAAEAIQKAALGAQARIVRIEKSEVRSEILNEGPKARIVKLSSPKYVYEAELEKTGEVSVAADGEIVEDVKWDDAAGEPEKK